MTLQLHSWENALILKANEHVDFIPTLAIEDPPKLNLAYQVCEEITAEHSRSFHLASQLLPAEKRRAVRALYAFCRLTDDIVDDPNGDVNVELEIWRDKVLRNRVSADDLVPLAWSDTRRKYQVPVRYMKQLIDGVARDLDQSRYKTFDELASYSYGVASTVGLMSMHIIGFQTKEALPYAIKLGVALQLTNILRDIGQDWQMGRVYLPQDELDAFGITEDYFVEGIVNNKWREFMRYQIERTRRLYDEAWPGIMMLNADGRFSIAAAASLYSAILNDIEKHDYDVFNRRAFVSTFGKLRRLPALYFRTR